MNDSTNSDEIYGPRSGNIAEARPEERQRFLVATYAHLFGAIGLFIGLITLWFVTPVAELLLNTLFSSGRLGMLVLMGAFVGSGYLAQRWARSENSGVIQYAGLGFYVFAESIIFVPIIAIALSYSAEGASILFPAAMITLGLFACLTGIVFLTGRDFSFMRGVLFWGGIAAFALALASMAFGFTLGLVFMWAMVALAGGYILYDTSNVMLYYRPGQHVAASLALFSSVALLFWYVLRIFIARRR